MPDDRTRHVVSELLNSIFDIDKMSVLSWPRSGGDLASIRAIKRSVKHPSQRLRRRPALWEPVHRG